MTIYASDERFFRYLDKYKSPGSATAKSFKDALDRKDIEIGTNIVSSSWFHLGYPNDLNKFLYE